MSRQVIAVTKHIRQSPQKIRVVARKVSKLPVDKALAVLAQTPKKAAEPILKTLASAKANAVHNFDIAEDNLQIKEIQVGRAMIRRSPEFRARGRLNWRRKSSSHVRVVLEEIQESTNKQDRKSVV